MPFQFSVFDSETPESGNNPDHLINGGGKNNLDQPRLPKLLPDEF